MEYSSASRIKRTGSYLTNVRERKRGYVIKHKYNKLVLNFFNFQIYLLKRKGVFQPKTFDKLYYIRRTIDFSSSIISSFSLSILATLFSKLSANSPSSLSDIFGVEAKATGGGLRAFLPPDIKMTHNSDAASLLWSIVHLKRFLWFSLSRRLFPLTESINSG